ncbi:MAG: hypothetical protein CL678_16070 [Bdellovibrionaceae bacterium]|nr:hypothetical protein [Pseudobdellovibrionaceae bacterium]|tara:strand:- start:1748 stop:2062 length:315 start_codon:yes stop_codon:yes gene_type:complete
MQNIDFDMNQIGNAVVNLMAFTDEPDSSEYSRLMDSLSRHGSPGYEKTVDGGILADATAQLIVAVSTIFKRSTGHRYSKVDTSLNYIFKSWDADGNLWLSEFPF